MVHGYEVNLIVAIAYALLSSVCLFLAEKFIFKAVDQRYPSFVWSPERKNFIACMIGADLTAWSVVALVMIFPQPEFSIFRCCIGLIWWATLNGWIFCGLGAIKRFQRNAKRH